MLHWKAESDDQGIVWLCLDMADAKANVLSSTVLRELNAIIDEMSDSTPAGVVIWSGKNSSFVMGADISEISNIESSEQAYELVRLGYVGKYRGIANVSEPLTAKGTRFHSIPRRN